MGYLLILNLSKKNFLKKMLNDTRVPMTVQKKYEYIEVNVEILRKSIGKSNNDRVDIQITFFVHGRSSSQNEKKRKSFLEDYLTENPKGLIYYCSDVKTM